MPTIPRNVLVQGHGTIISMIQSKVANVTQSDYSTRISKNMILNNYDAGGKR